MSAHRVVYTALFGQHERLLEQPLAAATDTDFICLTDDPGLRSDSWQIRVVEPILPLDPVRSARAVKLLGHAELTGRDELLWVDARVRVEQPPDELIEGWLDGTDLAVPRHSFRADVVTEFEAVLQGGLDDFSRIYEQLTHYAATAPDLLRAEVPWTGMLARRRTERVDAAMHEWLLHVLRYSRRDQLSFVHCMARAGVDHRLVDIGNHHSAAHTWLPPEGRSSRPALAQVSTSLVAPVAEVGELRLQLARQAEEMVGTVAAREARIAGLEASEASLRAELAEALARVRRVRRRLRDHRPAT